MSSHSATNRSVDLQSVRPLTPREREVLSWVVEGHTSREIAQRLKISRRTVEVHRANLMRKLGVPNTASLVRYALQHRLLQDTKEPLRKNSPQQKTEEVTMNNQTKQAGTSSTNWSISTSPTKSSASISSKCRRSSGSWMSPAFRTAPRSSKASSTSEAKSCRWSISAFGSIYRRSRRTATHGLSWWS